MQGDNVTKTGKIIWPRHLMLSFSEVFPVWGEGELDIFGPFLSRGYSAWEESS